MQLFIANKKYSSWSFRAWLTMRVKDIDFEEQLRPLNEAINFADYFEFSPSGKVPTLHHNGLKIYESLAILEYLAELYPDRGLWPADQAQRAIARCISHEMHGGFGALRNECPMNFARTPSLHQVSEGVRKDVRRIETLWAERLQASGGPFLMGEFCIADGMYAPVVNRLSVYQLSDHPAVTAYSEALTALPQWQAWAEAGVKEPWVVQMDEV